MRFSLISVFAFAAAALAQDKPNAFNLPTDGTMVIKAGQTKDLTWSNKQGSTVTLVLRTGSQSDLQTVATIVSHAPNTGSYSWTPDASTPEGSNYAVEIINDDDPSEVNYTQQFVIQSDVKAVAVSSSTGVVTATSASLVTSQPTAPATGSTTGSASASASGSASGMTTRTGSSSASATNSSSGSSTRAAASSTSAAASVPTTNAAAKPVKAAAGGLLAVAAAFVIAF